MGTYKRVKGRGVCAYCERSFDAGWSRNFPSGEITICDTCKESFEAEALRIRRSGILYKLGSKIKGLENAWLWFVAVVFTILGVAAFCIWVGSIFMFFSNLLKGG